MDQQEINVTVTKGSKYGSFLRTLFMVCFVLTVICTAGLSSGCEKGEIPYEKGYVVQVIDGDTVELLGGEHVRYLCIDTPERDEDYYHEASRRNKELVDGKMVELWPGLEDRDVYGRLLRFVFVDGTFVNAELVAEGLATAYIFDPNERYSELFIKLEDYAKLKGIGIWSEQQSD